MRSSSPIFLLYADWRFDHLFLKAMAKASLRVVSRHQNQRLTYDALDRKSNALARGLAGIGVCKGDRVAVFLGNGIEFATVWAKVSGEERG
jgi:non-ribosomal peptide synthetase component E (peptide arylation enzyme)